MKWVLLSDRLPPDFDKAIVRWEDTKELLDYNGYTLNDGTIDIWSGSGQGVSGGNYDLDELEWLDESEECSDGKYILAKVKAGSFIIPPKYVSEIPPDLINKILAKTSKRKPI